MGGIIWLASYPKSGNTWLRAFLANLYLNPAEPADINALTSFCYNEASRPFYAELSSKPVEELSIDELYQLRARVHRHIAGLQPQSTLIKTHCSLSVIGGVETVTPDVTQGAIYVVRNPFDVACSFRSHFAADMDEVVESLCFAHTELPTDQNQVHQYLGSWSSHYLSWKEAPGLNPLILRYEDMTRNPEKAFAKVVRYFGLPKDKKRLNKAIAFSSFKTLAEQEKAKGFQERPDAAAAFFRTGKIGDWRDELSDDHVARLIAAHKPVMDELGYLKPDGSPKF